MLYLQQAHIPHSRTHIDRPHGSAITFIALLHVAAIYALATSMGPVSVLRPPDRIVVSFRDDPNKPPPVPPPPMPREFSPPVYVPTTPQIDFVLPPESGNTITIPQEVAAIPPVTPIIQAPIQFLPARAVESTHTAPEYPLLSRRLGEKGSVRLALTIGEDGMVIDAVVLKSSGFARLDAAAAEWVKHRWRYAPAMRGTMPVRTTAETVLTFRLE